MVTRGSFFVEPPRPTEVTMRRARPIATLFAVFIMSACAGAAPPPATPLPPEPEPPPATPLPPAPAPLPATATPLPPVFLPGEQVDCLFEVVGEVTVQGPFRGPTDGDRTPREVVMEGVRLEVGQEAAGSGADGVMVREFLYDRDSAATGDGPPELVAVEGMLISFVDPGCATGG